MPRERSLDEFADPDGGASGESGASESESESEAEAAAPDGPDDPDDADPDGVRPATPTYDWTPGGAACADCGDEVEERWSGEAGRVCGDCKEW